MRPDSRTPPHYTRCTWYCTLPADQAAGVVGFALRTDAGISRYALEIASAHKLLVSLAEALGQPLTSPAGSQSPGSSLIPSAPRSTPSEAENVCPPATSLTAPATSS